MSEPTDNLFEAEGSYKELMSKLDVLMFEEVGLCKKMYQKAKNVSIEFSMFWMVVGALLQTDILKMSFEKQAHVSLWSPGVARCQAIRRRVVRRESQETNQENRDQSGRR